MRSIFCSFFESSIFSFWNLLGQIRAIETKSHTLVSYNPIKSEWEKSSKESLLKGFHQNRGTESKFLKILTILKAVENL